MAESTPVVNANLSAALKLVQELRANVNQVFKNLSDGVNSDSTKGKESKVSSVQSFHQNLLAVNKDISELQKVTSHQHTQAPPCNSSLLVLDPIADRHPLFPQLLQTHKWAAKLHDHAALAAQILQQNTLKRSSNSGHSALAKKQRKVLVNSHSLPPQNVDNAVQNISNLYNNMNITISRPFGQPAVLLVTLGKTLRAVVVLRGLIIEWISVLGYNENVHKDNKQIDIWVKSKYTVFQKVTDHAGSAMLHFYHPLKAELALRSFMIWFHSYITLFSAPCLRCHKYLVDNLPPTWRDLRFLEPYHENCRSVA